MAERQFELLAQSGGAAHNVSTLLVTAFVIVAAVSGVVYVGRIQDRRLREESTYADRVLGVLSHDSDGGDIRLGVRHSDHGNHSADVPMQQAEVYLEHHRIALKYHSDFQRASLWAGLLGFSVVVVGAALTYFVGLDVGVVTAVAGAIPAAAGRLLFHQAEAVGGHAAENLRRLEDSVQNFNAQQAALATTAEIGDPQIRDRMYEVIALRMLFPNGKPSGHDENGEDS